MISDRVQFTQINNNKNISSNIGNSERINQKELNLIY
jgi:hypothetical protein